MKKLSIILLASFLVASCNQPQKSDETTSKETIVKGLNGTEYKLNSDSLLYTFQEYIDAQNYYAKYGAHEIYYDDLIKYLKNYINQFPYRAVHNQFGTFIPAGDITAIPDPSQIDLKSGLLYFLCYDIAGTQDDTTDDRIFIAYLDKVDNFDMSTTYVDNIPGAKPCKVAYNDFQYTGIVPADSARVINFLRGNTFSSVGAPPGPITMNSVRTYMQEFHDRFVNRCFNLSAGRTPMTCNADAFGFFEKSEIITLTNQAAGIRGVRFFLGVNEYKPDNQIRVVLTSATSNSNLLFNGGYYAKFLERSYP